eukprot:jgi/Orpsp1_1/1180466/evm.model.c7180000073531.1
MPLYSILECDIGTIIASIVMNLILLPMLIVTYRIYRIIKSKTFLNKKLLDNKHLLLYFFIIIIVATIYKLIFVLSNETYILSYGFIDTLRIPYCFRNNYEIFEILDYAYVGTIFLSLVILIIMTGAASKTFGDIYYLFIVIFIWGVTFILQIILVYARNKYFIIYLIVICMINSFINVMAVHLLVGSRLITVIAFPERFNRVSLKVSNYSEIIPLRKDSGRYREFFRKITNLFSQNNNTT